MTSPLRITINSMAYGAAGVGRSDEGKVIFVPRTAPGDVVDVELTHQTASYGEGVVQTIVEPSPLRVKPICPHADVCGGCPWMHLSYSAQLEAKRANVVSQLSRIGGFKREAAEKLIAPCIPSKREVGYRNKTFHWC